MAKKRTFKDKFESYTYNHLWLKYALDYTTTFFIMVVSAAIFSFGMNVFLAPSSLGNSDLQTLVSGGSSGLAQTIEHFLNILGVNIENGPSIYSIAYFAINIPLIYLAFRGVGIRFGAFTLVNVALVFLFTNIMKFPLLADISKFISENGGMLSRAIFAGICTGLSSAIAYKADASAGGFDIVAYYLSLRKGVTTGKYNVLINAFVIALYTLITGFSGVENSWSIGLSSVFFSVVYLFSLMLVIDAINVRNKKVSVQIITSKEELSKTLLANIPHGATLVNGTGAFSGAPRYIIYMVVSSIELKHTLHLIKELDPDSFVNVTALQQVVGRFFMRPVK